MLTSLRRILYSLHDGFTWTMIHIMLLSLILLSFAFYMPAGKVLTTVNDSLAGVVTPVLSIRIPDGYGTYLGLHTGVLVAEDDPSWRYFSDEWDRLFTDSDILEVQGIKGVEVATPAIIYEGEIENIDPNDLFFQRMHEERINSIIQATEEPLLKVQEVNLQRAESRDMNLEEYLNFDLGYSLGCSVICIDTCVTHDWGLNINRLQEGRLPEPGQYECLFDSGYLNDPYTPRINNTITLLIGRMGAHNISGVMRYYDSRSIYSFKVVGSTKSTGEVTMLVPLSTFNEILANERDDNGPTLPIYTDIYVKVSTPGDMKNVYDEIKRMYPDAQVSRAGAAPITITGYLSEPISSSNLISFMSFMILGTGLVVSQLAESYRNRMKVWYFKAQGWNKLDILGYSLVRSTIIGLISSVISIIILIVASDLLMGFILPVELSTLSPEVFNALHVTYTEILGIHAISRMPLAGITTSVVTGILALFFLLYSEPPIVSREKQIYGGP